MTHLLPPRRRPPVLPLLALLAAGLACGLPNQGPSALTPAVVTDTLVPTVPPPTATSAPTAEQPDAPDETDTPVPTLPATPAPTASGDCANDYLPTNAGSTWTYTTSSSLTTGTGSRTVTTTKVGKSSFYHETVITGNHVIHYEVSWQCTPDGLVEFGGGVLASLNAASNVKIDILDNTGLTLPRAIVQGDVWSQKTEIHMTSDSLNGTGRYLNNYKAIGPEHVTVAAGSFDTLRVDDTAQSISDPYPDLNEDVTASLWYAPGVGLVKSSGHISGKVGGDWDFELDLASYKLP